MSKERQPEEQKRPELIEDELKQVSGGTGASGGGGTGKVTTSEIVITKTTDSSSPS